MNLADMLDRPIAFQRAFVSLGAGITGALMLSQAVYWTCRTEDADGWFYKTMDEWEAETGMTRSEQEGARKKLVKCGVLEEMKKGVPCRLYYRVNMDAIAANLNAENLQSSLQKTRKQGCGNPSGKSAEKPQASTRKSREQGRGKPAVLTETTSEITSEITPEISAGEAAPAPGGEFVGAEQEPGPRCQIPADMPGPKDPNCKAYRT
ncbi:replication protein O, partial [Pseudomonas aeruginosa]